MKDINHLSSFGYLRRCSQPVQEHVPFTFIGLNTMSTLSLNYVGMETGASLNNFREALSSLVKIGVQRDNDWLKQFSLR